MHPNMTKHVGTFTKENVKLTCCKVEEYKQWVELTPDAGTEALE